MEQLISDITRWYDLQTEYSRETARNEEMKQALRRSKWTLREKEQALVEYTSGLRYMIHKLTGKTEPKETMERNIREAKAAFDAISRDKARQEETVTALKRQCDDLPPLEQLKKAAREHPEAMLTLSTREKEYCIELLHPLLAKTLEGLEAYRQQLRGGNSDRIMSHQEIQEAGTAHLAPAGECLKLLNRMKWAMDILGQTLEVGAYFENPAFFIESAAARHNRLDRISKAISQVEKTQKQIQ